MLHSMNDGSLEGSFCTKDANVSWYNSVILHNHLNCAIGDDKVWKKISAKWSLQPCLDKIEIYGNIMTEDIKRITLVTFYHY